MTTVGGPGDDDALFVKRRPGAPAGFFAVEAAGLAWLGEVADGVPVVQALRVTQDAITLPRVREVAPTAAAAEQLGRRLARTHAAGASHHGAPPAGWTGDGWIATLPLSLRAAPDAAPGPDAAPVAAWGPWFAEQRLLPYLRAARDAQALTASGAAAVQRLVDRLCTDADLAGPPEPPSRLHGDLWSGNVLWARDGAVLIDPAAHGGHRESDLALLALFGLPQLDRVLAAYDEQAPLAEGWRERVALHQLYPLLFHAALFGEGYGRMVSTAAARYA